MRAAPRRVPRVSATTTNFPSRGFVRQAESDDTSLANSIDARGKFLDFVRIQIASAP